LYYAFLNNKSKVTWRETNFKKKTEKRTKRQKRIVKNDNANWGKW